MYRKVFVDVTAMHDSEGNILPLAILWEDGTRYEVDRVLDKRKAASLKVGGIGLRYKVRIEGHETYLYLEDDRFYVEAKQPPAAAPDRYGS